MGRTRRLSVGLMPRTTGRDDESTDRVLRLLRSPVTIGVSREPAGGSQVAAPQMQGPRQTVGFVPLPPPGFGVRPVVSEAATDGVDEPATPAATRRGGRHRSPAPRIISVPAVLRGGPREVRTTAVLALLAIGVLAGGIFVARVFWAAKASEPSPVVARSGLVARSLPSGFQTSLPTPGLMVEGAGPSAGASGQSGLSVRVHVVGEIADPGVVDVPAGARVIDAIARAGGSLPSADLERINLARVVLDGEQIHVPAPGEEILAGSAGTTVGPVGVGGAPGGAGRVNLNQADLAALDGLPGVGPVLAQRIIDWRAAHGRFTSVDELGEVSGIGEKLLAVLSSKVTV